MLENKNIRYISWQKLHDRQQIFVGRFYWQTKSANIIDCLTSP